MKVFVTGTRGFPGIMGGVETHCRELYPRLVERGIDVTAARRKPYVTADNKRDNWRGVRLVDMYAPRDKHFEAIVHTLLATFKARSWGADVLHIHGIGPGLVTPLARLLGMKVVLTVHSFNYDHDKWNCLAKRILRFGEWVSIRGANKVISISRPIKESLESRYPGRHIELIYNGVNAPQPDAGATVTPVAGIGHKPYILALGRLVPEKGFDILIDAYVKSGLSDKYDLVIAGKADHPTPYSEQLKARSADAGVILPGFVQGAQLRQLISDSALFALPSYHEGLPIALLEAMSFGRDVIASDIEPNRLPQLNDDDYFATGDADALAAKLHERLGDGRQPKSRTYDLSDYDWDRIADATAALYKAI